MVIDIKKLRRKAAKRKWEKAHPEEYRAQKRKQYHAYVSDPLVREKHRESRRNYTRQKRNSDAGYRIEENLRCRMYQLLRQNFRAGSAVRDLGMNASDFRLHIESQFSPGMDWSTWGDSFELDHIYPLASADLGDPCQFRAVANWRNYQPLTPNDNHTKGETVTEAARERFEVLANFLEVL